MSSQREHVAANQMSVTMRELRAFAGRSQVEVAEAMGVAQAEVSRLEARTHTKLSTIERYVKALGGEVEVVARFGDRRRGADSNARHARAHRAGINRPRSDIGERFSRHLTPVTRDAHLARSTSYRCTTGGPSIHTRITTTLPEESA